MTQLVTDAIEALMLFVLPRETSDLANAGMSVPAFPLLIQLRQKSALVGSFR